MSIVLPTGFRDWLNHLLRYVGPGVLLRLDGLRPGEDPTKISWGYGLIRTTVGDETDDIGETSLDGDDESPLDLTITENGWGVLDIVHRGGIGTLAHVPSSAQNYPSEAAALSARSSITYGAYDVRLGHITIKALNEDWVANTSSLDGANVEANFYDEPVITAPPELD